MFFTIDTPRFTTHSKTNCNIYIVPCIKLKVLKTILVLRVLRYFLWFKMVEHKHNITVNYILTIAYKYNTNSSICNIKIYLFNT